MNVGTTRKEGEAKARQKDSRCPKDWAEEGEQAEREQEPGKPQLDAAGEAGTKDGGIMMGEAKWEEEVGTVGKLRSSSSFKSLETDILAVTLPAFLLVVVEEDLTRLDRREERTESLL